MRTIGSIAKGAPPPKGALPRLDRATRRIFGEITETTTKQVALLRLKKYKKVTVEDVASPGPTSPNHARTNHLRAS